MTADTKKAMKYIFASLYFSISLLLLSASDKTPVWAILLIVLNFGVACFTVKKTFNYAATR